MGSTALATEIALTLPRCAKGIGDLITAPDSAKRIEGVRIEKIAIWPDDRGYFLEIHRITQGLAAHFQPHTSQVSAAFNHPGTIKAFHHHVKQTDCWTPAQGMLQVALVDLRETSPTYGWRNTMYVGALRPWQILIPPGVAHGYKVLGHDPAMLIYMTDRLYNPSDEGRIPYNDPLLNYDWETQHK
ncbi:MAG: dTDP-4-dehydrorhamnose 3,5-epimerase family protein [Acidobacteriota bacterium]|nr:dTDP-4-dehydrorhamnose 3,5-epimerase family protein [Acidobacteriota bacterium]